MSVPVVALPSDTSLPIETVLGTVRGRGPLEPPFEPAPRDPNRSTEKGVQGGLAPSRIQNRICCERSELTNWVSRQRYSVQWMVLAALHLRWNCHCRYRGQLASQQAPNLWSTHWIPDKVFARGRTLRNCHVSTVSLLQKGLGIHGPFNSEYCFWHLNVVFAASKAGSCSGSNARCCAIIKV